MNNTTNSHINNLGICDFISQLENIGSEKDKTEFIKNYSEIKDKISNIDDILGKENVIELKDKNITELFELLNKFDNKINNPNTMSIGDLNTIGNLIKLLEEKINQEINILEIK